MLTEKLFNTGYLTLNYGEGPVNGKPIVLLHGGTAHWQELIPLIIELKDHWHLFACDLRGHGKSGRAASYRAIDYIGDTISFIMDNIGVPTILLGHSGGAIAALGAAALVPDLVRAIILLDPPIFLREESIQSNGVIDYFRGASDVLTGQRTAQAVFSEIFPKIDDAAIQNLLETLNQVDPEVIKILLEDRYFDGYDTQDFLNKLTCPALMLYGEIERGAVVRDSDVEFFLTSTLKGTAIQIKDAGHLLHFDQPRRVLDQIDHFVEEKKL